MPLWPASRARPGPPEPRRRRHDPLSNEAPFQRWPPRPSIRAAGVAIAPVRADPTTALSYGALCGRLCSARPRSICTHRARHARSASPRNSRARRGHDNSRVQAACFARSRRSRRSRSSSSLGVGRAAEANIWLGRLAVSPVRLAYGADRHHRGPPCGPPDPSASRTGRPSSAATAAVASPALAALRRPRRLIHRPACVHRLNRI